MLGSVLAAILLAVCHGPTLRAQITPGEVTGTVNAHVQKYHGEFSDDQFFPAGSLSIQYAPLRRLFLEGRFGFGTYAFKLTNADLSAYREYFGPGARFGNLYPNTNTVIEPENAGSLITVDVLCNYVLIPSIAAPVYVTAGVGYVDWSVATANDADPLPNVLSGAYGSSAVSIPIGLGTRIPISARVGLQLRLEHRFVFSDWVDDVNFDAGNDGLSSASIGFTYTFTQPDLDRSMDCEGAWATSPPEGWVFTAESHANRIPCCCLCACGDHECDVECSYHELWCDDGFCCGAYDCCCCCCCCCSCCCCGAPAQPAAPAPAPAQMPAEPEPAPQQAPALTPSGPGKPAKKFSKDIRFKLDTDEFDYSYPQTKQNLSELLEYMQDAPDGHEVIIEGHASSEGSPARNKVLSDIRAKRIRSWLLEQGVDPSKIRGTVGYGSSMPKVNEPSPAEAKRMKPEEVEQIRAQNRRIEVYVLKDGYEQSNGS